MIKDIKMRLVALIEENYNSTNEKDFKVINFLPDIKVKKVIEDSVHKQDENGKYCFEIEKKDVFQISYTKNIKDLSVIVGENGSGKTTLMNQIFNQRFNRSIEKSRVHLVFEQKDNFWVYPESLPETLSIQAENKYPLIIKFSNATEFLTSIPSGVLNKVDASSFRNIFTYGKLNQEIKNEKITDLQEMLNQLKFINEFKEKIKRFVDYTQKEVEVNIEGSYLPCDSRQLIYMNEVELLKWSDREKVLINTKVVDFFSVLINTMLGIDYNGRFTQSYERLLELHLSFWERTSVSEIIYQTVIDNFNNFYSSNYLNFSRAEITLLEKIFSRENSEEFIICWLKIWHIMFIFHLYISYLKTFKELEKINNKYWGKIRNVLDDFKELRKMILTKIKPYKMPREYMEIEWVISQAQSFITQSVNMSNVRKWQSIWRKNSKLCIGVAREIRYISYFELHDFSDSIKYKLVQDRVWEDLTNFGTMDKHTKKMQEIVTHLYDLPVITTDFYRLSLFVNCVSDIKISEVLQCFKLKWMGLSSGELGLLKSFTNLYSAKIALQKKMFPGVDKENYLLLLDEIDLGLHPEWQRRWISKALPIIEKIFDDKYLQIIITTHSPIFLSDIYKENIIFLTTENNEESNEKTIEKTFGQNIYTLFKNSFFLNDVMGEYAFNTIKDTIEYLSFKVNSNSSYNREESLYNNSDEIINEKIAKKVIDSVGEAIIANQLKELFYKAFPNKNDEIIEIQNQINQLQNRIRQLEEEPSQ